MNNNVKQEIDYIELISAADDKATRMLAFHIHQLVNAYLNAYLEKLSGRKPEIDKYSYISDIYRYMRAIEEREPEFVHSHAILYEIREKVSEWKLAEKEETIHCDREEVLKIRDKGISLVSPL